MSKAIISFFLFFIVNTAFSQDYYCSKWAKQRSVTCVFAGDRANVWARQCENPCHWREYGPECDIEQLCFDEDPNDLPASCSPWRKERGVTCHNPSTQRFEQKWVRACQTGLRTTWCSDEDPNNYQ